MRTESPDSGWAALPRNAVLIALLSTGVPGTSQVQPSVTVPAPGAPLGTCGGVTVLVSSSPARDGNGGPFRFDLIFDASLGARFHAACRRAAAEWEALLREALPGCFLTFVLPYPVLFRGVDLGRTGPLADATVTWSTLGTLQSASIRININPSVPWHDNPDAEPGPGNYDLLSVTRHELGHAVGWFDWIDNRVQNGVYDPARLNVVVDSRGCGSGNCHSMAADHPRSVMNWSFGTGQRKPIQPYPDVAVIARSYCIRPAIDFVDWRATGTAIGTVHQPWLTIGDAIRLGGHPHLVVVPGTYVEPRLPITVRGTVNPVRGGTLTVR